MMHFFRPSARQRILRLLALLALSVCGLTAHATITCSITPPSAVNFAYVTDSNNTSPANVQQGSISATCTRTSSSDSTSLDLSANDGRNKDLTTNYVKLNNSLISYDFFRDSSCTNQWSDKNNKITVSIPSAPLNVPVTSTFNYWACKPTAQSISGYPSGVYTDRVGLTLSDGSRNVATASVNVNLYAPAVCSISNGPSTLTFTYQAFSPSAAFAGTSFRANCTNYLPYTMALTPVSGVVAGLQYTLGLSLAAAGTASNTGPSTLSAIGNATGSATHYINGSMAAAQAGQTGTPVPQSHTLTLTY